MDVYEFSEDFSRRSFRATLDDSTHELDFGQALRAESAVQGRLKFRWKMGARSPGHVVWTDDWAILLSEELRSRLQHCSGWSSTPVTLLLQTLKSAGTYHLLSVSGRCGSFIPQKTKKLPAGPNRAWEMYRGLCFERGAAEPDICMPIERTLHIFMSENAASPIRDLCDNVTLTPCNQVLSRTNPLELFASKKARASFTSSGPAQQKARTRVKKRGA